MKEYKWFLVDNNEHCIEQFAVTPTKDRNSSNENESGYWYSLFDAKVQLFSFMLESTKAIEAIEGNKGNKGREGNVSYAKPREVGTYGNLLRQKSCTQKPVAPDPKWDSGSRQRFSVNV